MIRKVTGVLLAAGSSRRFKGNKLLHPINNGVPMAIQSARNLKTAIDTIVTVTRPCDTVLQSKLREEGCITLINEHYSQGIGSSIACAVKHTPQSDGWVLALADMPYITAATIQRVVQQLKYGEWLAAPRYNNQRGHPVGISSIFINELSTLHGDFGARYILEKNKNKIKYIDCDDKGCVFDIDTEPDLKEFPKIIN